LYPSAGASKNNQNPSQQFFEEVSESESNCRATNTQQLNQIPAWNDGMAMNNAIGNN
jgi:hypothetical protein